MEWKQASILLREVMATRATTNSRLNKIKRRFAKKHKVSIVTNAELLNLYKNLVRRKQLAANIELENLLRKRKIRTLSGVAPIAVLTKPYPCPGKCIYCPSEKLMPKSYLSNEPAVMRAIRTKFNPFRQVQTRLAALTNNGHPTDKIELIVMGGTWSCLPQKYQRWFIKRCFDACNQKTAVNLAQAHRWNETAAHRIVGLTLETRPDYINAAEVQRWRQLGATRAELGVQILDEKILKLNQRGHGVAAIINATKLLKQAGFKITYHLMPNLPGATPTKDWQLFKKIFADQSFRPDQLKIYPTVVTKNSVLYRRWQRGQYRPYSAKQLFDLLLKIKRQIPEYVRLTRLIRDIPKESIVAGNTVSNLREQLQTTLKKSGQRCHCLRCREARQDNKQIAKAKLFVKKYRASDATEYFLQFTSANRKKLYAFLRLRLPPPREINFIPEIKDCAMIREVHTYGQLVPLKKAASAIQHLGFGSKLVQAAENIAGKQGWQKIAVIAGVGVRGFYRRLGYRRQGTYLIKKLSSK